jgi:hypothetical protein
MDQFIQNLVPFFVAYFILLYNSLPLDPIIEIHAIIKYPQINLIYNCSKQSISKFIKYVCTLPFLPLVVKCN